MKTIKSYIYGLIGLFILIGTVSSCAKRDYPDRFTATEGVPTIDYVRYAEQDVFITQAFMDEVICLVGKNLTSVNELYFNDQKAILNTSYITDNTLIVSVPSTEAKKVDNKIFLRNAAGDQVEHDFKVLPPVPKITALSNEWAVTGEDVILRGKYFMGVKEVKFPGADVKEFKVESSEAISFKIPAGASAGPVTVITESGTANSAFQYLDQRNMLFDFDGIRGGLAAGNGWRAPAAGHIHNPGDDAFAALDGSYLCFYDPANAGLKANPTEVWGEDPYSFNYWNSTDASSAIPPLNTRPAFATFIEKYGIGGLSLKFEVLVPASNPWSTCSMQVLFTGSASVSNDNANNLYLTDVTVPRALWTPWKSSGSFHSADKWQTVSIPLTSFNLSPDGSVCATKFDDKLLEGFSLYVYSGFGGTDCDPVIAIDHIRVVPM